MADDLNEGKKRLFFCIALAMLGIYLLIFAAIWLLLRWGSPLFRRILLIGFLSVGIMLILFMAIGVLFLVFNLLSEHISPKFSRFSRKIVDFFAPMVFFAGKLIGIKESIIQTSYIKIINQLNTTASITYQPQDVLILAPHCLQRADCPHKITMDVQNCHRCGRCSIHGLLSLAQERGVRLAVASGGTFARKIISEQRPKAVIAIACERDLTSGLHDTAGIAVVGVLNERPNGPCYNTTVQLCKVGQALDVLLKN